MDSVPTRRDPPITQVAAFRLESTCAAPACDGRPLDARDHGALLAPGDMVQGSRVDRLGSRSPTSTSWFMAESSSFSPFVGRLGSSWPPISWIALGGIGLAVVTELVRIFPSWGATARLTRSGLRRDFDWFRGGAADRTVRLWSNRESSGKPPRKLSVARNHRTVEDAAGRRHNARERDQGTAAWRPFGASSVSDCSGSPVRPTLAAEASTGHVAWYPAEEFDRIRLGRARYRLPS